jgi:hypothetical protein
MVTAFLKDRLRPSPSWGRPLGAAGPGGGRMKTPARLHLHALGAIGALACGRVDTQVGAEAALLPLYIEAEDGALSGGFSIYSDATASGGKFIASPLGVSTVAPGPARAVYYFRTAAPNNTYEVYGRVHGAGPFPDNCFWVSIDDAPPTAWRLSTGVIWYWRFVTSGTDYNTPNLYPLDAGLHQLVIQNCGTEVGLDRLYIARAPVPDAGSLTPANDTHCNPPHSIELEGGSCENSCGSQMGTACGGPCADLVHLPSYDCVFCCRILEAGSDDADDLGQ